ncbi:hypothetical protein OUZ56_011288 [Daphnia magna]|uniref:Uncharacterized protein n=1 Tax=Daphnia magna TaxID=35525 RepID=A0ABQ9YZR1_9CRUS|nr:hypothetical protein OUZ56_011288 [Daphnia magna]
MDHWDFHAKYPHITEATTREKLLDKFSQALLLLAKRTGEEIPNCTNDCITALILIMRLMPAIYKVKKVGFDSKLRQLFHFIIMVFYYILETENENISTVAQQKDVVYHKQPFLIVVGTIQHPITYFLVVDQTAIPKFSPHLL